MFKFKKTLACAVGATLLAAGLTACGSGQNATDNKSDSGKETEITYAIWDKIQQPGMQKLADEFMKENKNVKIKVQVIPWNEYWTKMEASANGKNLPDVFWMNGSEAARYIKADALMDLTESYNKEKGNYPEDLVKLYSKDNKTYAIPKDISTIGLWYNKEIFDKKGIAYPDNTWDWAKFKEVAKQLTDTEQGIYGFGAPNDTEVGYYNAIFQNGGKVLSDDKKKSELNNPATQEALQWWADFSLKDKSSPTVAQTAENDIRSLFASGKLAMIFDGSWVFNDNASNEYLKKNADIAVLPKGKVRATVYNGLGNAVSAYTKNKEAAVKFVEFLSSKKGMEIQGSTATAIPAYKGADKKFVEATKATFNTEVCSEMLEYGVLRPNGANFNRAESTATEDLAPIFSGKSTVSDATEKAAKDVNDILAE